MYCSFKTKIHAILVNIWFRFPCEKDYFVHLINKSTKEKYQNEFGRFELVEQLLHKQNCTHLGVGPMSKNGVDATIELANDYKVPLMLIASRRQIECAELGGGYVNNWDTISFAKYVRSKDLGNFVILARDHGGPWQHPYEIKNYPKIQDAMDSAKLSYLRDIEAGFQILHIDPVINNGFETPTLEWVLDKIFDLLSFCILTARQFERKIYFEIGTEEQKQNPLSSIENLEILITRIKSFCDTRGFEYPIYLVVQTGTKVMETKNVGKFPADPNDISQYLKDTKLEQVIELCNNHGLKLKEHNTDYLPDSSLKVHPQIGIHAANVAPEFGVAETKELLRIFEENGLTNLSDEFIDLAVKSNKWDKWAIDASKLSDREKTLICGHYVFSYQAFDLIKRKAEDALSLKGICLDELLKEAVKKSIFRYMKSFNLVPQ